MSINLIDTIKQKNGAIFPLVEDIDFKGGLRAFATTAERNDLTNFPLSYRKLGMFVWTDDTGKLWRLSGLPNTWTEFTGGGGGPSTALTDTLTAAELIAPGEPVSINAAGQLVRADAAAGGGDKQEVYGISGGGAGVGLPCDVTMSGILVVAFVLPAVPSLLYLSVGGGYNTNPPSPVGTSGRIITRIGQVRSANSILVRVQPIAFT